MAATPDLAMKRSKRTGTATGKGKTETRAGGPAGLDLASFGQALLQLDVSRLRTPVRAPPTIFTDRVSFSLGGGEYSPRQLKLAKADLAYLRTLLDRNGGAILALANQLTQGDLAGARRAAVQAGLTEDDFVAAGGGAWGLILLLIVILVTLPGDSPVPTAKEKAQTFKIDKASDDLMDGLKKK